MCSFRLPTDYSSSGEDKILPTANDVDANQVPSKDYITTMPEEILVKIFSSLPMEDLISLQFVSPLLKDVAQNEILWKNFTYEMYYTDPVKLKVMPAIRNIEGQTVNAAIKTILDNVFDLRRLNCIFQPDITESQMKKVVKKYKKLQSISVNLCAPSALECLKVLKCSKSLQIIKLYFCNNHYNSHGNRCSDIPKLTSTFVEEDDFPSLENIEVKSFLKYKHILSEDEVVSFLSNIIECKVQQLKFLKISTTVEIDARILGAINMCTKLQELEIQMLAGQSFVECGINRLTELRSLDMTIVNRGSNFTALITTLIDSLYQGSWSNLTYVVLILKYNTVVLNILESIIDNMKAVQTLCFESDKKVNESHLLNIRNLKSLENLSLCGVKISDVGLLNLFGCHNLRTLDLEISCPCPGRHIVAEIPRSLEKLELLCLKPGYENYICLNSQSQIREWVSSVLA